MSDKSPNADILDRGRRQRPAHTWWVEWFNVFGMTTYHVLGVVAFTPWFFSWYGLGFAVASHYTIGLLGVNLCYHRLLTHRAFTCPKWLEYSLAVMGVFCSQDSPAYWAATHRCHHQYTDDEDRDPHTPVRSFFWAHMGWIAYKNEVTERRALTQRYCRDLLRQPFYAWLEQHWLWFINLAWVVSFTAGFAVGRLSGMATADAVMMGITFVLWGVVVRTLVTWHITWGINSVSHSWGYRNYDTKDGSRNNFVMAILSHGEWHNNHHADPNAAMHGHRWWEIDPVWWVIRLFAALGLAKDIVMPAAARRQG